MIEDLIYDFYKSYHKLSQLKLDNTVKCLTQNEVYIIRLIANEVLTINELNEKLETTLGNTSNAINKLQKKNFVTRKKDDVDKRKVYVSLTKKGLMAYEIYEKFQRDLMDRITKDISNEQLDNFYNTFHIIKNNLLEIQKEYTPINIFELNEGELAVITEVKLSYAGFKYMYEKGIVQGKEIKVLEKAQNILKIETFKGIKILTVDDANGIYCIKKEEK